jgi:heterodisulfide reductase subunit B2
VKNSLEYSYYPGCSLHSTASEYNASVLAVFKALEAELHELEDWNCCGASSAHIVSRTLSLALPARNLALAQTAGRDVVMPCAACFNRHKTTDYEMRHHPEQRSRLEEIADFSFTGEVQVRPLLDVFARDIGPQRIQNLVKKPLTGLKVVGYYGCLLVRPAEVTEYQDPDHPADMETLLESLGADARPWSYGTECCGGGLSLTKSKVAGRLVSRLAAYAAEAGASAIVTSCPLCQVNLEMRQNGSAPKLPVFYFTELVGLALGLPQAAAWWGKHLINPAPLLKSLNLL